MEPTTIVNHLLETAEKWDNVAGSFRRLYGLRQKSLSLYQQMARAIEYERALAHIGLKKADVSHPITGAQIGDTHNYKKKMPASVCTNEYCSRGRIKKAQAAGQRTCGECYQELQPTNVVIPPSMLRDKMAKHIVGVETTDGRTIFFDKPLHPQPWTEWANDEVPLDTPSEPMPVDRLKGMITDPEP